MSVTLDLETRISDVLRADADVAARVADRVWLTMPAKPTFPAVLIRRIGGTPPGTWQGEIVGDGADIDIHCYGGSRVEALGLAQDAMRALGRARTSFGSVPYNMERFPDPDVPYSEGRHRERYILSTRVFGT